MLIEKSPSKKPVYNLSYVVNETEIKADTLRAWERRYKLPMPVRTPGGHRLYSEFDIQVVKWLQTKQNEGLSISKSVKLWNENKSEGLTLFEDSRSASDGRLIANSRADISHSPEKYRRRWVNSCLKFDELEAEMVINKAFGFFDVEVVCLDIFQEGLVKIGNLWYAGKATVQQEHFASGLAVRRMNALIAASPKAIREDRIVVATPPNEDHIFPSLILTLLLRLRGLSVTYLGANVPQDGLEIMLKIIDPALLIMSSSTLRSIPGLFETANRITRFGTPFGFGGRIFHNHKELRNKIPGHYLGNNLLESVRSIENLLELAPEKPGQIIIGSEFQEILTVFLRLKSKIETGVAKYFQVSNESLEFHHRFTSDNIEASLTLGLDKPLQDEMKWAKEFINTKETSSPSLNEYLNSYLQISQEMIGDSGQLIQQWLEKALIILQ